MSIAPKNAPPRTCPSCHAALPLASVKRCPVCRAKVDAAGSPGQAVVDAMLDVLSDSTGKPRRKAKHGR